MTLPVLQNFAQRRGALTRTGHGSVPLAQFMLVSGSGITAWAISLRSGTAGHWTLPIDGTSPTPTAAGDGAELNGGPYVFDVTATNIDGTAVAMQLTITAVADTYTVSKPAELTNASTGLKAVRAALGGKTVAFARGCVAAFPSTSGNSSDTATFSGFNTHVGRFTVTSEDTANRTEIRKVWFNGGCSRIDVTALRPKYFLAGGAGPDIGQPKGVPYSNNLQNFAQLHVSYSASNGGICSDIAFSDMDVGVSLAEAPYASQWVSAISVLGQYNAAPYAKHNNISFSDIRISCAKDGIGGGFFTDCTFESIDIDRFCSNAMFITGQLRNTFRDIVCVRPTINRNDPGDHRDFNQVGGGDPRLAGINYDGHVFENLYFIEADGNSGSQGPFFDDVAVYPGSLKTVTGFKQNNMTLRRIFYDGAASQGTHTDGGDGWDVSYVTAIRGECRDTSAVDLNGNFVSPSYTIPAFDTNDLVPGTGLVTHCAYQAVAGDSRAGNFPGIATLNAILDDITPRPSSLGFTVQNEAARVAYYSAFFNDPGKVIDYPNLTARQILAQIRIAYAAKLDGPLKNADGTYNGAFFPDGADNDGSVYLATPPSLYTATCPLAEAAIGQPVSITITLDAAASSPVIVTPHLSGVSGAFAPTTLTLAPGESSGVLVFTPSSAGTASLTFTNDSGLTDAVALGLSVASPLTQPTAYTMTSLSDFWSRGSAVPLIFTLNRSATADVIITPATTGAGDFSAATLTIPFGSQTGVMTFLPSASGSITFSATNDSSLANPGDIVVIVTDNSLAQLIVLGIR
jgi:hypothetical protein